MKECLVSWYGITDFKASLGIEKSGPLLGAILSTHYTEIQLLGYTNNAAESYSEEVFDSELASLNRNDTAEANNFVYKWANTQPAHHHFINWLQNKVAENTKSITIGFTPVKLRKLNDTEGIYAAAVRLLEAIAENSNKEDIYVTLFLSPGTPVMAFCWAMAALKFPQFRKRLIASPDPRKGPENIGLPQEWMEWYGKQMPLEHRNGKYFDMIFHLYGDQRIPTYLGLKQFNCKSHVFITSSGYHAVDIMKQFVKEDIELLELNVDAYNPKDVQDKLLKFIEEKDGIQNQKIGFNLTGGTKLMYAGALNVCRQLGGIPFYFNTRDKKVIFLNDFSSKPIVKIEKVKSFIKLNSNGLSIGDSQRKIPQQTDMISLTNYLWKRKEIINDIAGEIKKRYFELRKPFIKEEITVFTDNDRNSYIKIKDRQYVFEDASQFKVYLTGGWFEEYVYNNLKNLVKTKKITDLHHSLKISYETNNATTLEKFLGLTKAENNQLYQELDVVFTDGNRLYVIECKSGRAEVEHIMKLENIVRYYGGLEGKGILLYINKVDNPIVVKKATESKNVRVFDGDNIISKIEEFVGLYD